MAGQADMDLENMVGMQPALYHRYNVDENEEEEDEDNEPFKATFNADSFHNTQVTAADLSQGYHRIGAAAWEGRGGIEARQYRRKWMKVSAETCDSMASLTARLACSTWNIKHEKGANMLLLHACAWLFWCALFSWTDEQGHGDCLHAFHRHPKETFQCWQLAPLSSMGKEEK
eukprot:1154773-Pelagomonas_calceolata.AAC.4